MNNKAGFFDKHYKLIIGIAMPLLAILSAFFIGSIVLAATGFSPLEAYSTIFRGAFGTTRYFTTTLVKTVPYLIIGVAVAVSFKGASFNIGAEGQFFAGALGAVLTDMIIRDCGFPSWLNITLIMLGSIILGGVAGFIPGYLKASRGASEAVTTVMLSTIIVLFVEYLVNGPLQEPQHIYSETEAISESSRLPMVVDGTKLHIGFIIAILVAIVFYIILNKTTIGYKIRACGTNMNAAEYAGISPALMCVMTLTISGALAGLAGGIEVSGVSYKLGTGISPGYGYTAIAVALLGKLNPLGIMASAFLFGSLTSGCNQMAREIGIPSSLASLIQALVLIFVVAYSAYGDRLIKKHSKYCNLCGFFRARGSGYGSRSGTARCR